MLPLDTASILTSLAADMAARPVPLPETMQADAWLLASALQKAIRRGEERIALSAALGLWQQDKHRFWKRLHIIALEDVGVANTPLLVQVLAATASSVWRRKVGDREVGLHLVRELCQSPKCRLDDTLYIHAVGNAEYDALRHQFSVAGDDMLADVVSDASRDIVTRSLALWYMAGTQKYPHERLPARRGEPADAAELLRTLTAPPALIESCLSVMLRTPWPLALFTPLIWQKLQQEPCRVEQCTLPMLPSVHGVPIYAADGFTRVGLASLSQLRREVTALAPYSPKQIALALFYLEGGIVNRLLTSPWLEQFTAQAELIDAELHGLSAPDYLGIRDVLQQHMTRLHAIRAERLAQHLEVA